MDPDLFKSYELYLADRSRLATAKLEMAKSYDQTILTLSGGAVALSITFLEKLVRQPAVVWILYISWLCFGVAILCTLYSLLASQRASAEEIRKLDAQYRVLVGVQKEDTGTVPKPEGETNRTRFGVSLKFLHAFAEMFVPIETAFGRAVRWLNRLAGVFFFLGFVVFATFAMENWSRIEVREEKAKAASRTSSPPQPTTPTQTNSRSQDSKSAKEKR